jgi:hypothetical protein
MVKLLPPWHVMAPLGASTLWGSYFTCPQSKDVRLFLQWSWRLGGDVTHPCAEAVSAEINEVPTIAAPTNSADSELFRSMYPLPSL